MSTFRSGRMYRTRIRCVHFEGGVVARAESLTHRGWECRFSVEAETAQVAVRDLLVLRPDWHGVEVAHLSTRPLQLKMAA